MTPGAFAATCHSGVTLPARLRRNWRALSSPAKSAGHSMHSPAHGSPFRRLPPAAPPSEAPVRFRFEGEEIEAREGDSVAAALLAAGVVHFRLTPLSGAPRAPYCLMGACFECLVEIDGDGSRQACMVVVAEGMEVRRPQGARAPGAETPREGA
jgi:hypothetical protein